MRPFPSHSVLEPQSWGCCQPQQPAMQGLRPPSQAVSRARCSCMCSSCRSMLSPQRKRRAKSLPSLCLTLWNTLPVIQKSSPPQPILTFSQARLVGQHLSVLPCSLRESKGFSICQLLSSASLRLRVGQSPVTSLPGIRKISLHALLPAWLHPYHLRHYWYPSLTLGPGQPPASTLIQKIEYESVNNGVYWCKAYVE